MKTQLRANASELLGWERETQEAGERLAALPAIQSEITRLQAVINNPKVDAHKSWIAEQKSLARLADQIRDLHSQLQSGLASAPELEADSDSPNLDLMEEAKAIASKVGAGLKTAESSLSAAIEGAARDLAGVRGAWQLRFDEELREYEQILRTADATNPGVPVLARKLAELVAQERDLLQLQHNMEADLAPSLAKSIAEREDALKELQRQRRTITSKRAQKAAELTKMLGRRVVLEVEADADNAEFLAQLRALRTGSYLNEAEIQLMASKLHPVPFVKSLTSGDSVTLGRLTGMEPSKFDRFMSNILERGWVDELYELQVADNEDVIHIRFSLADGSYRAIEHLAHGQKCTVVLMVAMAEGKTPLLVDQPEDALHPPYIEQNIVATLREQRGRRQYIFATRNANILVSGDAEQVIVIDADANSGRIEQTGCVDGIDTRDPVIHHLEGGRDAFARKSAKYGAAS